MSSDTARHPSIAAYLDALCAAGRANTARAYGNCLDLFARWAGGAGVDLMRATSDQLAGYQLWIASDRTVRTGAVRARSTQATAIIVVQSFYRWMCDRDLLMHDPSASLTVPSQPVNRQVRKDHLTLQEATALIQTQAALVDKRAPGTKWRALEIRNLAMLALALATGRRVHGLVTLKLHQIDLDRNEVRIEREKGRTGRVLPVAAWAMATVRRYINEARPVTLGGESSPWLFISQCVCALDTRSVGFVLAIAVRETIARNPDLTDLPHKRISTHSLRVSFAHLLFQGGCNIRSINELMLHQSLSTTARYTPVPLADLRRALLTTHPRA